VAITSADQAALALPAPARHVAHQLVDHPARDAAILQPGRVGVPQVMWAVQLILGFS
jgi:hypothetical protein